MGDLIIHGDCIEQMRAMDAASVDAIVTDPPYELAFMGKRWDASGIAYNVEMWGECLRVLKPGGHLLSFGGDRTHHRMACAIEDAGFEIRTTITWLFGSGFPKSLDVGKAMDKAAGAEREVLCPSNRHGGGTNHVYGVGMGDGAIPMLTAPATDAAKQWDGWGTALKPAAEFIVMARKPFAGGVAQNVETWGTGALNVDGCRTQPLSPEEVSRSGKSTNGAIYGQYKSIDWKRDAEAHPGRWPSNLVLSHSPDCEEACADDCAVQEMDRQSGSSKGIYRAPSARNRNNGIGLTTTDQRQGSSNAPDQYGDSGGASRYFPIFRYEAKASSRERTLPDGTRSNHPTVKPLSLMRWLVRLVTPPGGVVLDPFAGSGTTLVAALEEGFQPIGIEQSAEYCEMIRARCDAVQPRLAEVSA